MELKLKRREVKVDVYGTKEVLRYPTVDEHRKYIDAVLKEDANEYEECEKFLAYLGMKEETIKTLELPDMQELIEVLTSQKKI